jgi:hypothetical protein
MGQSVGVHALTYALLVRIELELAAAKAEAYYWGASATITETK